MHTPINPPAYQVTHSLNPFLTHATKHVFDLRNKRPRSDIISEKKEIQQFLHVYLFEKAEIVYKRVAICVESQETIDRLIFKIQYMIKI